MEPHSSFLERPEKPTFCLPQELIDSLVDLVRDDHEILKNLGLVSTAWYLQTRIHLFHKISLGESLTSLNNKARCERLRRVLESRPELARLTNRLTLGDENHTHWIYSCPNIPKVLPLLTSLTQVILRDTDWAQCSPLLQIEYYNSMSRPAVSKLVLISITNIDLTPLAQYHHVDDLIMQDVRPSPATSATQGGACFPLNNRVLLDLPPTPPDTTRSSELRLTFGQCADALKTLIACAGDSEATLPLLRPWAICLGTAAFDGDMEEAWSLLLDCCTPFVLAYTIHQNETRHLLEPDSGLPPLPPMALPLRRFSRLRGVLLISTYHHFKNDGHCFLPHLARELGEIQAARSTGKPSELSHIVFDIDFNVPDDQLPAAMLNLASHSGWGTLDDLLSDSSFPKLEEVVVGFTVKVNISKADPDWQRAREALLGAMVNLNQRKVVSVDFEVSLDDLD